MCAFLTRHLEDLEPGLELYQDVRVGTEYPCVIRAGRRCSRVDILAQDKNGRLVVIECKKLFGSTTALGQLLGYMGWVQEHLCVKGEVVRGVLVVGRATPMLLYAVRFVGAQISVFECTGPRQLTRLTPAED
jgi:RecB family endonuclease NucS